MLRFLFRNSAAYTDCLLAKENLAIGNILSMERLIDEKLFNKVVLVENSNSNLRLNNMFSSVLLIYA